MKSQYRHPHVIFYCFVIVICAAILIARLLPPLFGVSL